MKRKFLAALLALVMVFSMIPVSASAADDNVIYAGEDNGINITLNHRAGAVGSTEVSFTVVVDGKTVVNSQSFTSTTTRAYINISADSYDIDIETEKMSCTPGLNGNYNLGFDVLSDKHSCTIELTTAKTKDEILIESDETTYGTFSWSKQHAGNCDFKRTVEIYVNDEFAYSQTVKTPNQLSNIMGVNKQFWFTPAEGYKDAYSMNREVLDTAALKDLRIDLITVCRCGLDTCVCDGGCSCPKDCDCEACTGATLKPNQIQTDYGLLEYSEATASGYNLTVVINVNGEIKYTSPQLRISCGLPGNLKFTPTEGEYYLQDPNSYDLDTLRSGSTWIPGTGQLSIVGVTDEVRDYDNKLTIYLVSFENKVSLDVERRVTIDDSISGYRISYTLDGVDYSFDWNNFNASQPPSIPTNVPVTVTAICDSPYEVAQWSTGNAYGGNVSLKGSEGQDGTEAYGNTVTLTVNSVGDPRILLYMDELTTVTVPSEDDLIDNPEQSENDVNIIGNNAVKIHCANGNATHQKDATYGLEKGTFTIGTLEGNSADGYTCDITITQPEIYVQKYNDSYQGHELLAGQETKSFTLKWVNGEWTVPTNEIPVAYNVTCDTEPEDETPEKPTWEDVERIFKDAIKVDCVNSNATHNDETYDALEGSYTLGTVTPSENLYTVELTFSAEKYLSEYNNLYGNHVLTGEQKNVLTLIYRNDIWCYEGGERYPVIFSVTCEDGGEKPDSNFVTQYWVMNDLDVIEKVFSAKEPDKELAGIELGTSTGIATDGEASGNGWNTSEDKLYYIVSNGELNGDNYVPWKEVSRLTFLYENGSNGITNLDIRVEEPDENGISKVYLLYDVRYNFNNGTTNRWDHTDSTKNWASASTYTVVTPTSPYLTPPNGDGREVELIGWSQTQHNTIFEPNAELPDHLTAGGTFTVDPNAENTNNTSLMINLYAVWAYKDTSTEPTPEPTPDPDPTPDPTPTPGPGGGDKPPYIPPVDPDDSGVSDLLNTDDHIQYLFGYPEGTFGPENNMTRAEVAQMFYNLLLDQDVTITKTFDDVPANAWYAKAVNTLASLGVVSGVGNGDFEPERSITRAEFTSIAMKFAEGKTGGTNIFSDVKSTDWFYRAVVNSTQYGWIHGYGDGTFRPNNPITRVEVTAIVNNMLGREADVDFVTEHYDELNHFSDLEVSHWGYYHIVEATNDHDYTKPSSGENWTKLN